MNTSKCPKCERTGFEVHFETPDNSNYELLFVRCKHCKTVVGVMDSQNIGHITLDILNVLNKK